MSVLDKLKQDRLVARRARNATVSNVLGVVIASCETAATAGKEKLAIVDADVISAVQKTVKTLEETIGFIRNKPEHAEDLAKCQIEMDHLKGYLPTQMTSEQVTQIATERHAAGDNLGQIMAYLKANHQGSYDARQASEVVKRIIAGA